MLIRSVRKSGKCKGEHFDFESPAAAFRVFAPKRRVPIECLQNTGPLGVRAPARRLGRAVKGASAGNAELEIR